jgi:hypothetical protein
VGPARRCERREEVMGTEKGVGSWAEGARIGLGAVPPPPRFYFSFIIYVSFPNQKFKLNSNSSFNLQVSNIKPNSNTSTICNTIIYYFLVINLGKD